MFFTKKKSAKFLGKALCSCKIYYMNFVFRCQRQLINGKKSRIHFSYVGIFQDVVGRSTGNMSTLNDPPGSGSTYFNYKKTYSIILFAMVDNDYCFTYIDVGGNGRASDSAIFRDCI